MKIRVKDNIKVMIEGIGREFQKGDTIELEDKVAKDILKSSRHFEEVFTERPIETEIIKPKKKKYKGG